jgi:hypothetical protein
MFFMIKFNATAKKPRARARENRTTIRLLPAIHAAALLLEDREIITAMRYNFDIKNSLFERRVSVLVPLLLLCKTQIAPLPTVCSRQCHSDGGFKRLSFYTQWR